MNTNIPPDPYFNNIDFNPSFYQEIQQYLTEAYANSKYLKLTGGSLSGFLGIGRTARTELDVNGKAVINNYATSAPGNGFFGSIGTKLILYDGSDINTPYALGINSATLWYGVPTAGNHRFYTGTTERMVIDSAGDVGIGTNNPARLLSIRGTNPTYLRIQTANNLPSEITGIEFGIPAYGDASFAKITSKTFNNFTNNLQFWTAEGENTSTERITILGSGYIGIGTTDPTNILQIGSGERLRISNGNSDYTIIGTSDTSGVNNTSITLSGSSRSSQAGNIEYAAVNNHIFYTTSTGTYNERMRMNNNGNVGIGTTNPGTNKLFVNGTTNMTDNVTIATTAGNNPLSITSTSGSANNCIKIQNNGSSILFLGVGGNFFGGNYQNNVFLEAVNASIIFNVNAGTNATPRMIIKNDTGNVGIATADPGTKKLYVNGRIFTTDTLEIDNEKGITFSKTSTSAWVIEFGNSPTSVADSMIFYHRETSPTTKNSRWWFNGAQTNTSSEISDERIKKEINDIQTPLNKIMELKPKEYYLCDEKDYNKKFGIIAQDVEKVFPEFIHTSNDYIANIYSYAKYNDFIITLDKDISNAINIDDELKIVLDNNDKNNLEIVIDDTPYNNRYKRRFVKVIEIIDNYSFKIDIDIGEENIFVYGKKVDDFKRLDYESLYCLNLAGTQELYKIIQQLQERISALEKI